MATKYTAFLLILSIVLQSLIASCSKPDPVLIITPETIDFNEDGGSQKLTIIANGKWSAKAEGSFFQLSPNSGVESASIIVTADPNEIEDYRFGSITFTMGGLNRTIGLSQAGKRCINMSTTEVKVPAEGGTYEIDVHFNTPYRVQSNHSWIIHTETKTLQREVLVFRVTENLDNSDRIGTVSVQSQDGQLDPLTISFIQAHGIDMKAKQYLREQLMDKYYFWNTSEVESYANLDIYQYFKRLLKIGDKWSLMMNGPEYIAEEESHRIGTYGASFGQPDDYFNDDGIYVRYVYPGSPLDMVGVKRGWKVTMVDNRPVDSDWLSNKTSAERLNQIISTPSLLESHVFEFKDSNGRRVTKSLQAAVNNQRPCLIKRIFSSVDYSGLIQPVGYFHYLSFKADADANGKSMLDDITEPMAYFKENGVKTLIVDLRYNGGGDSRASDLLVSYLAPKSADGRVYVKRTHNDKLKTQDSEQKISCAKDSPEFEKIYFITGNSTASTSEIIINGLKPISCVTQIGKQTAGKPYGMYVFLYPEHNSAYNRGDFSTLQYVFCPVCFYNANGEDSMIPDMGIVPDNERPDDILHDFGPEEDNIAACLYNIVKGGFPGLPMK